MKPCFITKHPEPPANVVAFIITASSEAAKGELITHSRPFRSQLQWHAPLSQHLERGSRWSSIGSRPAWSTQFQDSQEYTKKPCLEKQKKKRNKEKEVM